MFDKHHNPIKMGVEMISDMHPDNMPIKVVAVGGGYAFFIQDTQGARPWALTEEELIKSAWVVKSG